MRSTSAAILSLALVATLGCAKHFQPPSDTGKPCSQDADCSGHVCQSISDGAVEVCTSHCADSSDCLAGWACHSGSDGVSTCTCHPSAEVCDGRDNDCNGIIDDLPDAEAACRASSSGLACARGACACEVAQACGGCVDESRDPKNCGGCGNVCPEGPAGVPFCAAGQCASLEKIVSIDSLTSGVFFATDAVNLYGAADGEANIVEFPLDGGQPTKLAESQGVPLAMLSDGTSLFWTTAGLGAVYRVPVAGGTTVKLAGSQYPSFGLAVDAQSVYWTTQPALLPLTPPTGPGQVMKAPKGGGPSAVLADDQNVPWGVAVDATNVYWTDFGWGTVTKVPKDGGPAVVLASGQMGPTAIAVDATSVYWTNVGAVEGAQRVAFGDLSIDSLAVEPGSGSVMRVPIDGGTPVALASKLDYPSWGIAVDSDSVYWLASEVPYQPNRMGAVMRVPLAGGAPAVLIDGQDHPWSLSLVGSSLYWSVGSLLHPPSAFAGSDSAIERLVLP